jgi:hypothetical protein
LGIKVMMSSAVVFTVAGASGVGILFKPSHWAALKTL